MQTLFIILLAVACILLAFFLYAAKKSLRGCITQLQDRAVHGGTAPLRLVVPSAAAEELSCILNGILKDKEQTAAAYRADEQALRAQIANVSHDLRTPLTSILGYLQLLAGDALSPEERREYLAIVQSRAMALQTLITGFYDLSRLEGEGYPLTRKEVALSPILSELLAVFYSDLEGAGLHTTVALAEHLPPVMGDPAAAQRIFENLLRNAVEHGKTALNVRLYQEEDNVVSVFSNDTDYMCPEDASQVFERFFTSDKMRTGRNAGLGLAIVKGLAEKMGCDVSAHCAEGSFAVTIRWNASGHRLSS